MPPYAEIPAEQRVICEDLIFNRDEDALARFIHFYEQTAAANTQEKADPTAGMTVAERLHWKIVHRKKEGVEADIDMLIADRLGIHPRPPGRSLPRPSRRRGPTPQGEAAVDMLNSVLLPAMKEVGDLFGAGQLILPFVLQSAEVMKKTVAHLEQYLDKLDGASKGKVVLATVYGDVHDIGKNLVNTILSNNGYTVYDLGKQVPLNTIIEKAVEVGADAIGLSALLVSTSKQMPLCVQELHRRGLSSRCWWAARRSTKQYGQRIMFVGEEEPYEPGVFYCKDAFEGLETMDKLSDPNERGDLIGRISAEAEAEVKSVTGQSVSGQSGKTRPVNQLTNYQSTNIPAPAFWGSRVIRDMPLEMVFQHLDIDELYRLQWGAKNTHGDEWVKLKAEFEARLDRMKREALRSGYLKPQAVYGYFPAQSSGKDAGQVLIPIEQQREIATLNFRAKRDRIICVWLITSRRSNRA